MSTSLFQTPDAYLQAMIDRVRANGSRLTDFSEGSGARSLYEAGAVVASQQSAVVEQMRQDSYLATATGDALTLKALDYQVERIAAVAAQGTVTIARPAGGTAVQIPAGWAPLQTVPAPGQTPVQVQTTEDAVFQSADLSITVAAVAITTGTVGNLPAATPLTPLNPVTGFNSDNGFTAGAGGFTGGVDEESDDALRARVPIAVQGRVKGRPEAFLAAALSTPGVTSANVLKAGDSRGDGTTLSAGVGEVYWKGPASATTQVNSAIANATVLNQQVSAIAATSERIIAALTVYTSAGVDTAQLRATVLATLQAAVDAVAVGGTLTASQLIKAVHGLEDVISVGVPFTELRKSSEPGGTSHDVPMLPTRYPALATADCTITVTAL